MAKLAQRRTGKLTILILLTASACSDESDPFAGARDVDAPAPDGGAAQAPDPYRPDGASARPLLDAATRGAPPRDTSSGPGGQADSGTTSIVPSTIDAGTAGPQGTPGAVVPAGADAGLQATRCRPGIYQGTFAGVVMPLNLLPSSETVSGTVRLELQSIAGEDRLLVTGEIDGLSQRSGLLEETWPVTLGVSAVLNCATHEFEEGGLIGADEDGDADEDDDIVELIVGTLDGTFSDNPPSLNGTWAFDDPEDPLFAASGTWSALPAAITVQPSTPGSSP